MHKPSDTRSARIARPGRALRLLPLAAAVAAALLASGCSLIPAYERPAAPIAGAWPDAVRIAASATGGIQPDEEALADRTPAVERNWQDFFPDERLRRLVDIALQNNRDLRGAVLNIEQARAQFQIQRANQFPTVGLAASGTRQPNAITGQNINTFAVGLALSAWEIDFFGRLGSLKEQALAQFLATEEARKAVQISLVAAVANNWLALLADEELLDISRRTVETRDESIKLAKLRLDNGVASELDYRQAESLAESARATLAQQQRQRALDENALVLLLGQPLPEDVRGSLQGNRLADAQPLPHLPAGLPSDLLQNRPDIRQAEQALIGANANIGAARANFFPRVSLTAQAGRASTELSGLFNGSGLWAFTLAPQMLLPIFDAGRNRAGLASAEVGRDIAVAQYEKSIQTAFREVSDALAGRATLDEQLRAFQAQAEAESVRFKLSDLRYRNGISNYLDLLDAQRSLFTVQQLVVQSRLAQVQNQVQLYRALGGGWTEPPEGSEAQARVSAAPR